MNNLQSFLDEALKEVEFSDNTINEKVVDYNIQSEISALVMFYRTELNITQKELAEKSGVSQSNISKIENDSYCPSVAVLKRIADAMGKRLKIDFIDMEEDF